MVSEIAVRNRSGTVLDQARAQLLRAETTLAMVAVAIIGVMILPVPALILDLFLTASVALSLLTFLFALHIERPLEFSVFPSVLLIVTLFRLALNIASTRLILLGGGEEKAAGDVIRVFGQFLVDGNTVVGVIVFLILVVINFVVITKGAGRIAEVSARFTLDAMPGKQMAIDADLAAGLIDDKRARARREQIEQEADFFASMDGASKFVRGDAMAGLLITAVNMVGGLIVGVGQNGMAVGAAVSQYTTLTVGDGLVSQVPALLTSVAAGLVITRASAGGELASRIKKQLFGARRPVAVASAVLGLIALFPGMPHVPFFLLAVATGVVAWRMKNEAGRDINADDDDAPQQMTAEDSERAEVEATLPVDLLEVAVGYELVSLVDAGTNGTLLRRIAGVRKQLAGELGLVLPPVHVRDNLRLPPAVYSVLLAGNEIGRGTIRVDRLLAMRTDGMMPTHDGEETIEPTFGLPAKWIDTSDRDRAELEGCTVVDPSTVIATHIGELVTRHAAELLGIREAQELIDLHAKHLGKLHEAVIPSPVSLAQLTSILQELLRERVPIRDFRSILEAIAQHTQQTSSGSAPGSAHAPHDSAALVEAVRQRLRRSLTARHKGADGVLYSFMLSTATERTFRQLQGMSGAAPDRAALEDLMKSFEEAIGRVGSLSATAPPVLLVVSEIRRTVASFVHKHVPEFPVLSFREVSEGTEVRTIGVVGESKGSIRAG